MHKVQCDGCRNEVEVVLYFSDKRIITHEAGALNNATDYEAVCRGEAICPICGCNIDKLFKKIISGKSIVDLAVGNK